MDKLLGLPAMNLVETRNSNFAYACSFQFISGCDARKNIKALINEGYSGCFILDCSLV